MLLKISKSTPVTTESMALNIPPLPRPAYLQGVTITNTDDYKTKSALHVFEHGRLSTVPCELVGASEHKSLFIITIGVSHLKYILKSLIS